MGRFGCSNCYKQFGSRLDPILKRVHGNTVHVGKIPKRTGGQIQLKREIEELRRNLHELIDREEFENAAQIRDRIRELERNVSRCVGIAGWRIRDVKTIFCKRGIE